MRAIAIAIVIAGMGVEHAITGDTPSEATNKIIGLIGLVFLVCLLFGW